MKPEGRLSALNRSFRRSFRKKKTDETKEAIAKANVVEDSDKAAKLLRDALGDEIRPRHTDHYLKKLLKGKGNNIKEAEKLYQLIENARRFLRVRNVLEDFEMPEVNLKYNITGFLGFDKQGSPVRVLNLGDCDFYGFLQSQSTLEMVRVFYWFKAYDEKMLQEENKKTGRDVHQYVYILNMEHLISTVMLYKPVVDMAIMGVKLYQELFYEDAKDIYMINVPTFFPSCFKLVKAVIDEQLQDKLKILGDDWRDVLLKNIDADVLPEYLGGTRVDENKDPKCSSFIGYGGKIPESYYFPTEKFLDPKTDPFVNVATVEAGSFLDIPIKINEIGTIAKYHVESKDHDLGLAVYFDAADKFSKTAKDKSTVEDVLAQLEPLTPLLRCQCHIAPEIDCMVAWKAGTYILHLDNTYSWFNPKQVCFKFEIIPPNQNASNNNVSDVKSTIMPPKLPQKV